MSTASRLRLRLAAAHIAAGGVVAHPTEAVFGLGADPEDPAAVQRILALKRRPMHKGLILIGADTVALLPYLATLPDELAARLQAHWPGPLTWLAPAAADAPPWITGGHPRIAVRVPGHAGARALCRAWGGALVSTSANRAGRSPLRTAVAVRRRFGPALEDVLPGAVGTATRPSEIRDLATDSVVRPG